MSLVMDQPSSPSLSIIVVCFNMRREAQRTLYTLSEAYQQGVESADYQVIVIDNNSEFPLSRESVKSFGPNFEHHYFDTKSVSPAEAINFGVSIAKADTIACIVDGARMLSPGIIKHTLVACKAYQNPFVTSLAWHLGPKEQNHSMLEGYNQTVEDELLETINWKNDGYRLFDISTQASSSKVGFFGGIPEELSYFAIDKPIFERMGGFCEDFQSPGGGLVNHDFLHRALKVDTLDIVMLLGEGSFHQFHGGVATNAIPEEHPFELFAKEFLDLKGEAFRALEQPSLVDVNYLGSMPLAARRFISLKSNRSLQ